jgi:hypothetical protein
MHPARSILDRVMVNLDRILQQKTPCAGQIDTILYVKQAPAREAVVDGLKELAKLKRCGRGRGPIDRGGEPIASLRRFRSRAVRASSVLKVVYAGRPTPHPPVDTQDTARDETCTKQTKPRDQPHRTSSQCTRTVGLRYADRVRASRCHGLVVPRRDA